MEITDPEFFHYARRVAHLALAANLPPRRAFAIGRQLAAGLPRAQQQRLGAQLRGLLGRVGAPGHDDPRIVEAHRLLTELPDADGRGHPALASVRVLKLLGRDAYTVGGWIFMSSDSVFYQTTNLMGLAMLLHHESFHISHPTATEPEACAASLRFAEQHGDATLVATLTRDMPAPEAARSDDRTPD